MSKKCERCLKTVYPVEELKCMDKVWHKSCFRCTECGMVLNLRNYKGYDRMPYCSAHTPKMQATQIASTLEMKRVTHNTRIQSNVKYHEDFERGKNRCHQIADDAEIVRSNQNSKMSSIVAYRVNNFEYRNIVEQRKKELDDILQKQPSIRSSVIGAHSSRVRPSLVNLFQAKTVTKRKMSDSGSSHSNSSNSTESSTTSPNITDLACESNKSINRRTGNSIGLISQNSLEKSRLAGGNEPETMEEIFLRRAFRETMSISSMDSSEMSPNSESSLSKAKDTATVSNTTLTELKSNLLAQGSSTSQKDEEVKKITNFMDPYPPQPTEEQPINTNSPTTEGSVQVERRSSYTNIRVYRALYDFDAQDIDEVSFRVGDHIVEVEPENSGWLIGRVERTGRIGMLPGNYVEVLKSQSLFEDGKTQAKQDTQDH